MKGLIYQRNDDFLYYRFDKQFNIFEPLYFRPWIRIGPYLVGVIAAYIVLKLNNKLLWKKKNNNTLLDTGQFMQFISTFWIISE